MIARVGMSCGAIEETWEGRAARDIQALHVDLLQAIAAHAILVFGNQEDQARFVAVIADLTSHSQDAAKRWEVLLERFKQTRRIVFLDDLPPTVSLNNIGDPSELRNFAGRIQVAVLEGQSGDPIRRGRGELVCGRRVVRRGSGTSDRTLAMSHPLGSARDRHVWRPVERDRPG